MNETYRLHVIFHRVYEPDERSERFEEPLDRALVAEGLGTVTGGGTGSKTSDIVVEVSDLKRGLQVIRKRPALEKAVPAMVLAPQSFGSLLNFHPHLHGLLSLGVFTRDGVFHPVPDDLDFRALEALFREETFKMMLGRDRITEERVELLRSWRHSGFRVHAERGIPRATLPSSSACSSTSNEPPCR